MADTTVCVNRTCTKRMACYRYRAHWSPTWQSVSLFRPVGGECVFYSELREEDSIVPLQEADSRTSGHLGVSPKGTP